MLRLADESQTRIVGDVEPLVAIGSPGIGIREASHQGRAVGSGGGPQPEGSVDVHPRVLSSGFGTDLGSRIERAGIYVAGLYADDGALVERRERIRFDTALIIGRKTQHARSAESQHRERFQ